jgi:hypothetical protein
MPNQTPIVFPTGALVAYGIFWLIFGLLLAIIPYKLAPRMGGNRWVWLVLSLIPGVNFVFLYYVFYRITAHVLDRLNAISARIGASPALDGA